jgi:hypothetical protein
VGVHRGVDCVKDREKEKYFKQKLKNTLARLSFGKRTFGSVFE